MFHVIYVSLRISNLIKKSCVHILL